MFYGTVYIHANASQNAALSVSSDYPAMQTSCYKLGIHVVAPQYAQRNDSAGPGADGNLCHTVYKHMAVYRNVTQNEFEDLHAARNTSHIQDKHEVFLQYVSVDVSADYWPG